MPVFLCAETQRGKRKGLFAPVGIDGGQVYVVTITIWLLQIKTSLCKEGNMKKFYFQLSSLLYKQEMLRVPL